MRGERPDRGEVQCPCCDFHTLSEVGGEICLVCYWEDDGFRKSYIDVPSGANHGLTLRETRANFIRLGACCELTIGKVLTAEDRVLYRQGPSSIDK